MSGDLNVPNTCQFSLLFSWITWRFFFINFLEWNQGYILAANPFSSTKLGLAKRVPTRGPNHSFDEWIQKLENPFLLNQLLIFLHITNTKALGIFLFGISSCHSYDEFPQDYQVVSFLSVYWDPDWLITETWHFWLQGDKIWNFFCCLVTFCLCVCRIHCWVNTHDAMSSTYTSTYTSSYRLNSNELSSN